MYQRAIVRAILSGELVLRAGTAGLVARLGARKADQRVQPHPRRGVRISDESRRRLRRVVVNNSVQGAAKTRDARASTSFQRCSELERRYEACTELRGRKYIRMCFRVLFVNVDIVHTYDV